MDLGFIGLGKMGANMVRRLRGGNHRVWVYDRNTAAAKELEQCGATPVATIADLPGKLSTPRVLWIMVPAGAPVDECIDALLPALERGDVLVDGGNSNFRESIARASRVGERGVLFLDAGTSGGVWGLANGYCLMVGGEARAFQIVEPALRTLAPPEGYLHAGGHGAGHFAKMIHNGIEYGMMQAYAEGFEILQESPFRFDLHALAKLWGQGSVVRSWLLDLIERMLAENPKLEGIRGFVPDSGEGRWTVEEAIRLSVPAPILTLSLLNRFRSRRENTYTDRFLAALRNQFGGHEVKKG